MYFFTAVVHIIVLCVQQDVPIVTVVNIAAHMCGCFLYNKHVNLYFIDTKINRASNTMVLDPMPPWRRHTSWSLSAFVIIVLFVTIRVCHQYHQLVLAHSSCCWHHYHSATSPITTIRFDPKKALVCSPDPLSIAHGISTTKGSRWTLHPISLVLLSKANIFKANFGFVLFAPLYKKGERKEKMG